MKDGIINLAVFAAALYSAYVIAGLVLGVL